MVVQLKLTAVVAALASSVPVWAASARPAQPSCKDGDWEACATTSSSILQRDSKRVRSLSVAHEEDGLPALSGGCSFESDFCGVWSNARGDTFDWTRKSGRTPSGNTGPNSANDGRWYMYIEASSPRRSGDTAELKSKSLLVDRATKMEFKYHMYGSSVGSLEVLVNGVAAFSKSGNQGNAWKTGTVTLQPGTVVISFKGVRGGSWSGDVAIDKVSFTAIGPVGPTPPPTPAPPTPAVRIVTIGRSSSNTKCVQAAGVFCPPDSGDRYKRVNRDHWNAKDDFDVTMASGDRVCARRMDSNGGWGMNLALSCTQVPTTPTPPPTPAPPTPSPTPRRRRTVPRRRRTVPRRRRTSTTKAKDDGGSGGAGFLPVFGGIVGGLLLISGLGFYFLVLRGKRKNRARTESGDSMKRVHPEDSRGASIQVRDVSLVQNVQEFFDKTFKDRSYKGTFTPKRLQVVEVHKVSNHKAEADYEEYKAKLRRRRGKCSGLSDPILSKGFSSKLGWSLDESLNEYFMFHGTNPTAAVGIIETDFRLPKNHTHGAIYGNGVYVAESNTKAHMYCQADSRGCVPILISRVLLGKIHNTVEESPNGGELARSANRGDYDSVCGDRRKLKWNFSGWREFIVYDNAQADAKFLVWCKPK